MKHLPWLLVYLITIIYKFTSIMIFKSSFESASLIDSPVLLLRMLLLARVNTSPSILSLLLDFHFPIIFHYSFDFFLHLIINHTLVLSSKQVSSSSSPFSCSALSHANSFHFFRTERTSALVPYPCIINLAKSLSDYF